MADVHSLEAEFIAAYERYADAIFRHCYFRTFNRERGKELMQETFLKVWEYLQGGHRIDSMQAFLYRTANNLVIDEARRRKRRREESLEVLEEMGFDPANEGDEENMQQNVEEQQILRTMHLIEQPYRDALIMRFIDGLSPAEIAELTGETANVISVRLNRGLKKLRSHLAAA